MFEFSMIMMIVAMVLLSAGFWLKGKEAGRREAMTGQGQDPE